MSSEWQCMYEDVLAENRELRADNARLRAELEAESFDGARWRFVSERGDTTQWSNILRFDVDEFPSLTAAIDRAMGVES